jgi:hypothetical protein
MLKFMKLASYPANYVHLLFSLEYILKGSPWKLLSCDQGHGFKYQKQPLAEMLGEVMYI